MKNVNAKATKSNPKRKIVAAPESGVQLAADAVTASDTQPSDRRPIHLVDIDEASTVALESLRAARRSLDVVYAALQTDDGDWSVEYVEGCQALSRANEEVANIRSYADRAEVPTTRPHDEKPAQGRRNEAEATALKVRRGDAANPLDETIGELLIKTFGDNDGGSVARSCLDSVALELSILGTLVGDVPDIGNLGLSLYRISLRCEAAAAIDGRMAAANGPNANVKALHARIDELEAELAHATGKAGGK